MEAVMQLYDRIINDKLLVRRLNITANNVVREQNIVEEKPFEQIDLFTDYELLNKQKQQEEKDRKDEKKLQQALIDIKKKYGKNAVLKGMNFIDGGTTIERNSQIGGHKE
jgi:DNA polymerase V